VCAAAGFRLDDVVLDVGCAEGLLTFQVAERVRQVRAIEFDADRARAAERIRGERGVANASIERADVAEVEFGSETFDVILYLGVFHNQPEADRWMTFERLARAARRALLVRTPFEDPDRCPRSARIAGVLCGLGFDVSVSVAPASNVSPLIAAHRRPLFDGAVPEAEGVWWRSPAAEDRRSSR